MFIIVFSNLLQSITLYSSLFKSMLVYSNILQYIQLYSSLFQSIWIYSHFFQLISVCFTFFQSNTFYVSLFQSISVFSCPFTLFRSCLLGRDSNLNSELSRFDFCRSAPTFEEFPQIAVTVSQRDRAWRLKDTT